MYNTESATTVAEWCNNLPRSEFDYCEETLYRKRTGEYFLYGEGGAGARTLASLRIQYAMVRI